MLLELLNLFVIRQTHPCMYNIPTEVCEVVWTRSIRRQDQQTVRGKYGYDSHRRLQGENLQSARSEPYLA